MKKFPVGIQNFRKLRENDLLYIDKTQQVYQLVDSGNYFFLSRPRRFGKSLLVSTLEYLYLGERAYFKDLWIEDKWDWDKTYPVLHFKFSLLDYQSLGLENALLKFLKKEANKLGVSLSENTLKSCFAELLNKLYEKGKKVVILIDEYDKPLIDYLGVDEEKALEHQQILKNFYSVLKDSDLYIQFLFITGVSKFSKVGVFSDLNNLRDITMSPHFGTLCGYTKEELRFYFTPYVSKEETSAIWEKIKKWYNGYTWDAKNYVYNPFSILSYFAEGEFQNFWFKSGTPTFLINLLGKHLYYDFDGQEVGMVAFDNYDISRLEILPLLFQTGYLTIKERKRNIYKLGYPNLEVKESMLQHLIGAFAHGNASESAKTAYYTEQAFANDELETVVKYINSLFASIPYQLFEKQNERFYHAMIHLLFSYVGIYIKSEVCTSKGRADAVVETDTHVYILEFKLDKNAKAAIQQIKDRGYDEQYHYKNKIIKLVGINFNSKNKKIEEWVEEIV